MDELEHLHRQRRGEAGDSLFAKQSKKCFVFIDGDYGMKDQSSPGSRNLGSGTPDLPGNGLPNAVLLPPVSWVSSTSFLPSRAGERQPY